MPASLAPRSAGTVLAFPWQTDGDSSPTSAHRQMSASRENDEVPPCLEAEAPVGSVVPSSRHTAWDELQVVRLD